MSEPHPGVVLSDKIRTRNLWFLAIAGALATTGLVYAITKTVIAISRGDTESTVSFHGIPIPTWILGVLSPILIPLAWWGWRSHSVVIVKPRGLVNIRPLKDGFLLEGNFRGAIGTSLLVADGSSLRIVLVKTRKGEQKVMQLYGLRFASPDGNVVMNLDLLPSAFDLSPLLAELNRRRVSVDLDPSLKVRQVRVKAARVRPSSRPQLLGPPPPIGPPPSSSPPPSAPPAPYK